MKNFSVKKLVLFIISVLTGLMVIIGMCFPLLTVSAGGIDVIKDSGFSLLGFKSGFFVIERDAWPIIEGVLSWLMLISGIVCVILSLLAFFKYEEKFNKMCITAGIISVIAVIAYMVIGIVGKILYIDTYLEGVSTGLIKTKSFLSLIFVAILFIAYICCLKFIKEPTEVKSKNKYAKLSEEERLSTLLKYKELLNGQIITEEEFDLKKKELLLLVDNEEEKKVEKEKVVKKSSEEAMMEQILRYKKMYDEGIITEEEFSEIKKKLL